MQAKVVICGRPNVGKSSLFNLLTGKAYSLVHDRPGVTRDWMAKDARDAGFTLIDTAGMEEAGEEAIATRAWQSSMKQIAEAAVILLLVDARAGLLPDDKYIATKLRRMAGEDRIVLVVNKAENLSFDAAASEFHELGFARMVAISAAHNQGMSQLHELIEPETAATDSAAEQSAEKPVRLSMIGRPNVGKSTLTNLIIQQDRMLVSDKPGTTIDSVETLLEHNGRRLAMIDTAGVRRKARIDDSLEGISAKQARVNAARADVAILMLDADDGVVHQDQLLASQITRHGRTTLVVLNKADLLAPLERRKAIATARKKLPFMEHADMMLISAIRPRFNAARVVERALDCHDRAAHRVSANKITKALRAAVKENEPARSHGKRPSLRYAHQAGANPPVIVVHGRHVDLIKEPYVRYLAGRLASGLDYSGAPLRIRFKETQQRRAVR